MLAQNTRKKTIITPESQTMTKMNAEETACILHLFFFFSLSSLLPLHLSLSLLLWFIEKEILISSQDEQ